MGNVTNVNALFPLIPKNENEICQYERCCDSFTYDKVIMIFDNANYDLSIDCYDYKNIYTPLESINAHVRGGLIVTLQDPNHMMHDNAFEVVIVALAGDYLANEYVYLDDGVGSDTTQYTYVEFQIIDDNEDKSKLTPSVGNYYLQLSKQFIWGQQMDQFVKLQFWEFHLLYTIVSLQLIFHLMYHYLHCLHFEYINYY